MRRVTRIELCCMLISTSTKIPLMNHAFTSPVWSRLSKILVYNLERKTLYKGRLVRSSPRDLSTRVHDIFHSFHHNIQFAIGNPVINCSLSLLDLDMFFALERRTNQFWGKEAKNDISLHSAEPLTISTATWDRVGYPSSVRMDFTMMLCLSENWSRFTEKV